MLTAFAAVTLWLTILVGTYINFPRIEPHRLMVCRPHQYPRSLLQSSTDTAWLHSFAMEIKEHVPGWPQCWNAVAVVAIRYRSKLLGDARLNRMATALLAVCFALVSAVALLGVFINKVAPLD